MSPPLRLLPFALLGLSSYARGCSHARRTHLSFSSAMAPKQTKGKAKAGKASRDTMVDIATAAAAASTAPAPRRTISDNWGRSTLSHETLKGHQLSGLIPSSIKWRAAGDEVEPSPAKGEIVIFGEHLFRGFTPPGNLFFRQLLAFYKLCIHDLAPNSILNLSNFVVLCEDYLQIKPDLAL